MAKGLIVAGVKAQDLGQGLGPGFARGQGLDGEQQVSVLRQVQFFDWM
jgi:hypothetical protein